MPQTMSQKKSEAKGNPQRTTLTGNSQETKHSSGILPVYGAG